MSDTERVRMREQIITLAVGDLEDRLRKHLFRKYKDRRYRARQSARNLERVHKVAAALRAEFA